MHYYRLWGKFTSENYWAILYTGYNNYQWPWIGQGNNHDHPSQGLCKLVQVEKITKYIHNHWHIHGPVFTWITKHLHCIIYSIRATKFVWTSKSQLIKLTVKVAVPNVSLDFQIDFWSKPYLYRLWYSPLSLQHQINGYKQSDPATKQQMAIPDYMLNHTHNTESAHLQLATGQLIAVTLYFAMRSCKYSKTPHQNRNKQTPSWYRKFQMSTRHCSIENSHIYLDAPF